MYISDGRGHVAAAGGDPDPLPDCGGLMQSVRYSNALGLWTLYWREVRRFAKVYNQTVLAPVVTTLLFLAVFALALGARSPPWSTSPSCSSSRPGWS